MHNKERKNKISGAIALVSSLVLMLTGCSGGEEPAANDSPAEGSIAEVDVPLRDPVWSENEALVIALQEDGGRLIRLDSAATFDGTQDFPVTLSEEFVGTAGENLAIDDGRSPNELYIPQPERDQIKVIENDSLLEVRNISAGESPVRVVTGGSTTGLAEQTLYVLSRDGQVVTLVDLEDPGDSVAEVQVEASENALIAPSGADGFWLAGPEGVALYKGLPPELQNRSSLVAGTLAADSNELERAYVGEAESGRVVILEPDDGGALQVTSEAELNEPAEYLVAREGRLYAVTRNELVVLDAETLQTVDTVEFGPLIAQENLQEASPSGLAVGPDDVYVTLEGQPYVLLIEIP